MRMGLQMRIREGAQERISVQPKRVKTDFICAFVFQSRPDAQDERGQAS